MLEAVKKCEEFKFESCGIDWDDYVKKSVLGSQKYILKCDERELPSARRAFKFYVQYKDQWILGRYNNCIVFLQIACSLACILWRYFYSHLLLSLQTCVIVFSKFS